MPQVFAFIAEVAVFIGETAANGFIAVGLAGVPAATAYTVATTAVYVGATLGITAGLGALFGPHLPPPEAASYTIRQPISARISGVGLCRLGQLDQQLFEALNGAAYDVYADHDGPIDSNFRFYLNDDVVSLDGAGYVISPDGKKYVDGIGLPLVKLLHREGASTETAYSELTAALGSSIWPSTSRGDGIASLALIAQPVKSKDFVGAYPNGVPIPGRAANLQPVFDPRDGAQTQGTRSTYVWTDNAALGLLAYLTDANGGLGLDYDRYIAPAVADWMTAADVCNEVVAKKAGGTAARYRCWMTWRHDAPPAQVIKAFLASMDGWLGERGDGALVLKAGKYAAPTVSIAAAHVTAYSLEALVATDDAVNVLTPTYVSVEHDFAEEPTDDWEDAADIAARGRRNSQPLSLPHSPAPSQSSRLAKRAMARALAPNRGWVMTDLSGFEGLGERYLNLTLEEAGTVLFNGPIEVLDAVKTMGVGVWYQWVQADPNIDQWIPAVEEGDPAPVGDPVISDALTAPTIDTATPIFDSSSFCRIAIEATGPDRADLTWHFRWRVAGETTWKESTFTDAVGFPTVDLVSELVPVGVMVEIEVIYSTGAGQSADGWSATETVDTSADAIAPDEPAILSHAGGAGTYAIGWQNPASLNFYGARVWKAATGAGFGTAVDTSGLRLAAANSADSFAPTGIAAGTYDLWVTAENAGAAQSGPDGPVTVTVT